MRKTRILCIELEQLQQLKKDMYDWKTFGLNVLDFEKEDEELVEKMRKDFRTLWLDLVKIMELKEVAFRQAQEEEKKNAI